jgi:putative ABC transport system permease protein
MNFLESFRIAIDMLRQNKLRAFLTMLGVIIGVMSVTMIVMISNGFQAYISKQFSDLGASSIFVVYDPHTRMRHGEHEGPNDGLHIEDVDWLLSKSNLLDTGSAFKMAGEQQVKFEDKDVKNVMVTAVDDKYTLLNKVDMLSGRTISKFDNESRANVCVISEDVKNFLFPGQDPLGRLINFSGLTLEVVGVSAKPKASFGMDNPKQLFVPLSTALRKWLGGSKVDIITLRTKPGADMNIAMQQLWEALMLKSNNKPVYRVDSSESIIKVFEGVIGAAGMILAAIAALSLLVGGIGIMNIMLVSVTERTREIGLRKAVGARKTAILSQFLVEGATMSLVGGLIGMFLAWSLGTIVTLITMARQWPDASGLATPFPIPAAIGAALFSALIGVVFGLYPAVSAAKLDPIVALRHE